MNCVMLDVMMSGTREQTDLALILVAVFAGRTRPQIRRSKQRHSKLLIAAPSSRAWPVLVSRALEVLCTAMAMRQAQRQALCLLTLLQSISRVWVLACLTARLQPVPRCSRQRHRAATILSRTVCTCCHTVCSSVNNCLQNTMQASSLCFTVRCSHAAQNGACVSEVAQV